jgi:hypothetical protein
MSSNVKEMSTIRYIYMLFMMLLFAVNLVAQETIVVGNVRSKTDKSPIQSVNIYFKDTHVGVESDEDGFYVIKHAGQENTLVFSCIGYKNQEFKVKPGETAGLYVELREDINFLQDLFVLPGANPALDLMQRVREAKQKNDVYNYPLAVFSEEQQLVLLSRNSGTNVTARLFDQLSKGMVSPLDSTLFLPLYLSNEQYLKQGNIPAQIITRESRATPENAAILLEKLMGDLQSDLNFYHNTIVLFGKHFVSPLANTANSYYRFFLIDSVHVETGKQYYLRYRTRNSKNLAFNGELWIDSASHAITKIHGELPPQANINYIRHLKVSKNYQQVVNQPYWFPDTAAVSLSMNYQLLADSTNLSPEIYLQRKVFSTPRDTIIVVDPNFAGSPFTKEELELKLAEMNDLPLMKTAKWIADGVITGYVQAGKIDIGKVYQLARLTNIEGTRFNLPLRTNEHLWKDFTIGGYWGYGFRNKQHQYSAFAAWRLPFHRKTVLSAGYTDDLRRIDYDYNDFLLRENPLLSGDEDIANTYFGFRSSDKINPRKEFYASVSHDWNPGIESKLFYRNHQYTGNEALPFILNGTDAGTMEHQSVSLTTRFSRNERTYEDHLERIYIPNNHPVMYLTLEAGKAALHQDNYTYGKINAKLNHRLLFGVGEWNYSFDAGWILGSVPYNLLWMPPGSETLLFKRYHYNLMNYMEYAYDKYIAMHHEWVFNGILFNQIPVIRHLNLRELVTFKCLYGDLSNKHAGILDFPVQTGKFNQPYMEVGVGFTNIFRIFSLQSVWRLTDTDKTHVRPWSIITGIRFNF